MRVSPPPPLEPALLDGLRELAEQAFGQANSGPQALAAAVGDVSKRYTRDRAQVARNAGEAAALAARLVFFLPRDLYKVWGPLSELSAVDALPKRRVLRVLDLGAGLGTTTLGLASYAAQTDCADRLVVTAVDHDARALSIMQNLTTQAPGLAAVPVALTTAVRDLRTTPPPPGPFDVVLIGLSLNETLAPQDDDATRVSQGAQWLARVARELAPGGALVVIEPALRSEARTLHRIRDAVVTAGGPPFVFAPCLGSAPCPMLARKRDWCHEYVPWPLPEKLAAIAQQAGLRREHLTYSYLTLHSQQRSIAELVALRRDGYRVVSNALRSKGKLELELCGAERSGRLMRLDRHRGGDPDVLEELGRGTVLALTQDDINGQGQAARLRLLPGRKPKVLRRY